MEGNRVPGSTTCQLCSGRLGTFWRMCDILHIASRNADVLAALWLDMPKVAGLSVMMLTWFACLQLLNASWINQHFAFRAGSNTLGRLIPTLAEGACKSGFLHNTDMGV